MPTTSGTTQEPGRPHLKRVLSLWDLVYYGIILTSPIAAVPLFGEAQVLSRGHTVTTLLLAMIAMSVTAVSFGRMANVYPSSGSVYSYISKALNPHVGFILGWAMFLEYLFQPIQNSLYAVLAIHRMVPQVPFALLAAITVGFITLMTVQGIKFTARTNEVLLGVMLLVTAVFLVQAFRYVVLHQTIGGLFSMKPIYNPATFDLRALAAGTSFAALVFIGFDGVSILAEEVKNPRAKCPAGRGSGLSFYGALQRPSSLFGATRVARPYDSAKSRDRIHGCRANCWRTFALHRLWHRASGSSMACGLAGHVGAAPSSYSMGRDDVIPKKIFGHLSPKEAIRSTTNGSSAEFAYVAVLTIPWERAAEMVTFGACWRLLRSTWRRSCIFGLRRKENDEENSSSMRLFRRLVECSASFF